MLWIGIKYGQIVQLGDMQILVGAAHGHEHEQLRIGIPDKSIRVCREVLDPRAPVTDAERRRAITLRAAL